MKLALDVAPVVYERKCVKLSENSPFSIYILKLKWFLQDQGFTIGSSEPSIEVLNHESESEEFFLARINQLRQRQIDVSDPSLYDVRNSAIVLKIGPIDGYSKLDPHVKIAFLKVRHLEDALKRIKEIVIDPAVLEGYPAEFVTQMRNKKEIKSIDTFAAFMIVLLSLFVLVYIIPKIAY